MTLNRPDGRIPLHILVQVTGANNSNNTYSYYIPNASVGTIVDQKIGMEFANEVWGKRFQVVVTTHLNTKHLHCHFVINSISFVDGKHLWGEEKAWFKFRKVADRICEKYGLYYDPNPNRSKQSDYLTMKEKAGMPTRYSVAKEAIDYAIDHSKTLKEFQFEAQSMILRCCPRIISEPNVK